MNRLGRLIFLLDQLNELVTEQKPSQLLVIQEPKTNSIKNGAVKNIMIEYTCHTVCEKEVEDE